MSFTTVAAGQPIRSTHINQFTRWITGITKDVSQTLTTTSASEYTSTLTNEDTSAGLVAKFVYGVGTAAVTLGTINKTGATFSVPIIATGVLAGLFTATGQTIYGSGGTGAATLNLGAAYQSLNASAGATAPAWMASLQSLMVSAGSLVVASAANTPAHLPKGTAFQDLGMNSGATGQTWATGFLATVQTAGDLIYGGGANTAARLAIGADGTFLTLAGGAPTWGATPSAAQSIGSPIINGDFNVWQRGVTFNSIADSAYFADRWRYSKTLGTGVHNVTQSTDVPAVATSVPLQNYSVLLDCTATEAALGATEACRFWQSIEGFNWLPFAQRAFTLSFWAKATKTGTYCVAFQNSGVDRSYVAEYSIASSATWEQKSITVSASPSAGTWNYGTGVGVYVEFVLAAGTNAWATAGAWTSANLFATANQVNSLDSASNDFRIAQVQIDLGAAASAFTPILYSENLQRCQRYFWKSFPQITAPAQNAGATGCMAYNSPSTAANSLNARADFPVTMRSMPTATYYNPYAANAGWGSISGGSDTGVTATTLLLDDRQIHVYTATAPAAGTVYGIHATVSAEL